MIETALGAGPALEANRELTYPETGIARQILDARGMTQICSSPVVVGESPSRSNSAMLMYLIVVRGGIPGSMLRLETTTRLGRSVDNTYQLDGNTVSRH